MPSDAVNVNLSPHPILEAFDGYRGMVIDFDHSIAVDSDSLLRAKDDLGQRFAGTGLAEGDRVVVAVGNGPLFIATLTALLARGGAPLLVHAKTPPAELQRASNRFGARFVVTDSWTESELLDAGLGSRSLSADDWVRVQWVEIDTGHPSFETRYPRLPGVPLHPTSGTTGQPKVAVRPGASAVAEAAHYIETIGIRERDVILAVPPMSHAYAYGMGVMVPLLSGADVVTLRAFKSRPVHRAVQEAGITIFPAVPGMIDALLFGAGDRLRHFPRWVLSAGAPLTERSAGAFREKSGTTVRPLYGTTETGGISVAVPNGAIAGVARGTSSGETIATWTDEAVRGADDPLLPTGCVGPAMNGVAVDTRTAGPTDSSAEGLGTLHVRSSSMMAGYLSPGGIDTSPVSDGWFDTGDLAHVDEGGAIHLKGRRTEVINVGGLKVVPSEVEEVLSLLPQIVESKVYAGKMRSGPQFVKAAIVKNGALEIPDVKAHCERHLVYYKRPSAVLFVESLPKTPSGKVILDQLP